MRYGILSDIHGNLEALQKVVSACQDEAVGALLCLGDIVGYGANPKECLDMVRELNAICVAGNHDWAATGKIHSESFNPDAKEAIYWTQQQLTDEDTAFLNGLSLVYHNPDLILVHGSLSEPERFHYMMYMSEAAETFYLMNRAVCFVGHSHVPQIIVQRDEENVALDDLKTKIQPDYKYIVNAGSVGQPRDGNPMAVYGIYDTETGTVKIKRTAYDIGAAQEKIIRAGLPMSLAERLAFGL